MSLYYKLETAKLCGNCDTVHDEKQCPICGSEHSLSLAKCMNRDTEGIKENVMQDKR
jgi:rRNA maturation endonuclease Nob1